jgi:ornithine cyclodeaminase
MNERDILIVASDELRSLLNGRERALIEIVRHAYIAHGRGETTLPHSLFLRFPASECNRIIALPAFLGGDFSVAGIKWIASFPGNVERGSDRASGIIILNSISSGRPEAILEGSLISAKRTAASAALAAQVLAGSKEIRQAGFIGCGFINFEVARFLLSAFPALDEFVVFDSENGRAKAFAAKLGSELRDTTVMVKRSAEEVLSSALLVSIATTAVRPHILDLSMCHPGMIILGISLRDIAPEALLKCSNIVDDVDHVCRAQTSIHLAEQLVGNRSFVRSTLPELLDKPAANHSPGDISIFSPFGLGILDLAVGAAVRELAIHQGLGTLVHNFLPDPWRAEHASS